MAFKTFAAIYVGSSEVAMSIYEISSKKTFKLVDSVTKILELGKDTYGKGQISTESIRSVCGILNGFKDKMKEYQVSEYRAYATSAVREAGNTEIVLDSIKRNTNIDVSVLSNSEQRYISYKGLVAKYDNFQEVVSKNTAFVDVGAGSVQISIFDKNNLVMTENIPIGAIRIRDYLSMIGTRTGQLDKLITEYVENEIVTLRNIYLNDKEIKNIIAVGEVVNAVKRIIPDMIADEKLTSKEFDYLCDRIVNTEPRELSEKYGIPYERATLMLPNIIIYKTFLNHSKAEEMYVPRVDFCEGIVADYMSEGNKSVFDHNFNDDIVATAYNISKRYKCNRKHIDTVSEYALKIFDSVRKVHGMGKKERIQLHIAAILHECGNFINLHDAAKNSYYIIANTEILGISHKERMEIANTVKYNVLPYPSRNEIYEELDDADYILVAKLAAILRIANVLDKSHTQKLEDISVSIKDDTMVISAKTYEDITLEAGLFEQKADFFEKVYGIRPVLRVKRSV